MQKKHWTRLGLLVVLLTTLPASASSPPEASPRIFVVSDPPPSELFLDLFAYASDPDGDPIDSCTLSGSPPANIQPRPELGPCVWVLPLAPDFTHSHFLYKAHTGSESSGETSIEIWTEASYPGVTEVPLLVSATAVPLGGSQIQLEWDDLTNGEECFEIFRGETPGQLSLLTTVAGSPGTGRLTWLDTGASESTTYYYRVAACGAPAGSGNELSATTPAENLPPQAGFTAACEAATCVFDALGPAGSWDDDGIVSFSWQLGDGQTAFGPGLTYTYPTGGTYEVSLVIADAAGQQAQVTHQVVVDAAPEPAILFDCQGRACLFDGSSTTDDEGILSYQWTLGDGQTAEGVAIAHTYAQDGDYTVSLTVTDFASQTRTASTPLVPVSDLAPIAAFSATCESLDCTFDATCGLAEPCSSDDVGIVSYSWSFGDGLSGTGIEVAHTFAREGSYAVVLTVTDGASPPQEAVASQTLDVVDEELMLLLLLLDD